MTQTVQEIKNLISNSKNIVITTHKGPDGDAMGSALGMYHLLKQLGHSVSVITPNEYAQFLHWLPGNEEVIVYEDHEEKSDEITKNADIIFLMDLNNINRLSTFSNSIQNASATKILIDHHEDPDKNISQYIISEPSASSTAELVYELIATMRMTNYINKEIAECLYVGIMTDTGSFKYPSTQAKTHDIIAKLISAGANNPRIHDLIYDNSSANRIELLGYCLNQKLLLYPENNSAIISLTAKELIKFNFKKGDTEGFVNFPLSIKGIKFVVFITEKEGIVKLSLRSKGDFKVNIIAKKYFSGGGHINAAGGISQVSVNETIKKTEEIIQKYKQELNNIN